MSAPILRGADLRIDKEGRQISEVVRLVLNPIWNAFYFFTLYANADAVRARRRADQRALLDRYVLAKTRELVQDVQAAMDDYDLAQACTAIAAFLDALNNWYIRRSRPRFWGETGAADRQDAYDTLWTVLDVLCRVAAPLLPLLTEHVWRGLTGAESVHLADWPDAAALPEDHALVGSMDRVRDACSVGLSLRESRKLRTRLPLPAVTLAGAGADALRGYAGLLQEELNVKQVAFAADVGAFASPRLQVDAKTLGPKLGPKMKDVLAATRSGAWRILPGGRAALGGVELDAGEFELKLVPKDGVTCAALPSSDLVVVLDVAVTPELEREGVARDFVRLVQQARKDAGLHVSDRIALAVHADAATQDAIAAHRAYVQEQVLAKSLAFGAAAGAHEGSGRVGSGEGREVQFALTKA
jgi:isoleucyl-tRNA synthetase